MLGPVRAIGKRTSKWVFDVNGELGKKEAKLARISPWLTARSVAKGGRTARAGWNGAKTETKRSITSGPS